jgi:cold shock protein
MKNGTVKWFNNAKGYGFILADDVEGEIFAHFSAIQSDGYKTLHAGQAVTFELNQGPKGLHALNILGEEMPEGLQTVHARNEEVAEVA